MEKGYIFTRNLKKYLVKHKSKLYLIPVTHVDHKSDLVNLLPKYKPVIDRNINDYISEFIDLDSNYDFSL